VGGRKRMFTGIIEEVGRVVSVSRTPKSRSLVISADIIFDDLKIGDSVCVNGVCLTATKINSKTFTADVMNETFSRSSLGGLTANSIVNLERAMPANGRFGGHIVSGHIDGMGSIVKISEDDNAVWFTIKCSREIMSYIIEKGSIAIDGISLTVAKVTWDSFSVSVIPHTLKNTALLTKGVGSVVNLENDMVGKYIENFLKAQGPSEKSPITYDFLMKNGF
jgi:riboflavin synthase